MRLQSGWQRTEQEKGVYDFAWLDAIVDSLVGLGLKPWMCLCYGTGLYGGDTGSILDYGYFGVLAAEFGPDGRATGEYSPKPSYHALGALASILRGTPRRIDAPVDFCPEPAPHLGGGMREPHGHELLFGMLELANGARSLAYWLPTQLHTVEYDGTATVVWRGIEGRPLLADPLSGTVEPLPEACVERLAPGVLLLRRIPLRDTPLFLLDGTPWQGTIP